MFRGVPEEAPSPSDSDISEILRNRGALLVRRIRVRKNLVIRTLRATAFVRGMRGALRDEKIQPRPHFGPAVE